MKRSGTQVVLLTLLSSVAAVKFHDAMVVLKPTPAPDKGEFDGKGSPEEENQLSTIFQGMDLDSSGDLDLNELGAASFGEEWKGAHKVELEKQIQTLLEQLDVDGSGTLNLEEYEKQASDEKKAKIVKLIQEEGVLRMAQNFTVEAQVEPEDELDPDDSTDSALVLGSLNQSVEKVLTTQRASSFVSFAARRKSNKKQKKWAAKEMGKMEKTICKRHQRSHHQTGKPRD